MNPNELRELPESPGASEFRNNALNGSGGPGNASECAGKPGKRAGRRGGEDYCKGSDKTYDILPSEA